MSSTSILSSPTGPRELLTMLAMEAAAMTVETYKNALSRDYAPLKINKNNYISTYPWT